MHCVCPACFGSVHIKLVLAGSCSSSEMVEGSLYAIVEHVLSHRVV
jgi:hypothetical protein